MWKTVKLDEIVSLSMGKTPSRGNAKFWDKEKISKNIWLSIADLSALGGLYIEDSKEYVSDEGAKLFKTVPSETLVMSFKLSIGKLAITKCELRTNEAIAALPIKDEKLITKEYLYYFLSSIDWDALAGNDVKVKGKTLNKAKLKEIPISYPPLAEQQHIVAKLDAAFTEIDGAIDATKEKDLGALHFAFLKKSFSDYSSETTKKCLAECVETFHQGLNTAGEKVKFSDIGYPILQTRNIIDGEIDFQEKIKFVDEDVWQKYRQKYKPALGDVFFTNIGTIGKTAIVSDDADFLIHWNIFKIKVNPALLLPEFLKLNLDFLTGTGYFDSLQKGGTVNFVTKKMIGEAPIFMMSLNAQRKTIANYNKFLAKLAVSQSLRKQSLKNFDSLKSAILAQELQSEAA